jgi:hypothetical protein
VDDVVGGHDDLPGQRAGVELGQQAALRVECLVAVPGGRVADHGVDDDLGAVVQHAGRVAPERHRQPAGVEPDAAQRPQVVVVQRRRPDVHPHPALGRVGFRDLVDGEARERVLRRLGDALDGEHGQ